MKKIFLFALFFLTTGLALIGSRLYCPAAEDKKPESNIAVSSLLCNRPAENCDFEKLTNSLKESLSKAAAGKAGINIFILPPSGKNPAFNSTDFELAAAGKLGGADKLIVPYLYALDGKMVVSVKIIDCGRARKEANYFASCSDLSGLNEKLENISNKIALNLKITPGAAPEKAKDTGLPEALKHAQSLPYELSRWEIVELGRGCTLERTEQNMKISFSPAARNDDKHKVFGIFAVSKFLVEGDFDIVLDYSLVEWPYQNGTRIGIGVFARDGFLGGNKWYQQAERISSTWADSNFVPFTGDAYLVDTADDNIKGVMEAAGKTGRIRITRAGNVFRAYCRDDAENKDWLNIYSSRTIEGPVSLFTGAWNHDYCFTKRNVEAVLGKITADAAKIGAAGKQDRKRKFKK